MGDLNVEVGCDNQGMEHAIGTHGVEANKNGNLFMESCAYMIWLLVAYYFLTKCVTSSPA
jgi:hypothetical protein